MKETRIVMGMPVTVQIEDAASSADAREAVEAVFGHFAAVDARYSPFKPESEVSRIRRGELLAADASEEMKRVIRLCEETRTMTDGWFDAWAGGGFDPSGLVKGWSLHAAAELLRARRFSRFFVDGAGDSEVSGTKASGEPWRVGIRNPFAPRTIIKVLEVSDRGVATSGSYIQGEHIYDPHTGELTDRIAGITVIGPNVYEAARLATAAFAMGEDGIGFIFSLADFEGYLVRHDGSATCTPGFERYVTS